MSATHPYVILAEGEKENEYYVLSAEPVKPLVIFSFLKITM